jgi:hypothetical protein
MWEKGERSMQGAGINQDDQMDAHEVCDTYDDSVALTFHTKAISADEITACLGVQPDVYTNAGENVRHVYGKIIKAGLTPWSLWSLKYDVIKVHDDEDGSDRYQIEQLVLEILELCESHKDLLEIVLKDDGEAGIQIRLDGTHNIGDSFEAATLRRLAILGMYLSIEVFP